MSLSPVITIISDLGNTHTAIGIAKGALLTRWPDTRIIDLTHGIERYNVQQAAYVCRSAFRQFPAGSFHLLVVDIAHGERHRMLLARMDNQYFIAPDNNILSLAFGSELKDVWLCREFSTTISVLEWMRSVGDVIDAVGGTNPDHDAFFSRFLIKEVAYLNTQRTETARRDCMILYTDRYGNIVLDLSREEFRELIGDGPFEIKFPAGKKIDRLSNNYNDVEAGELLCRFNKNGLMELAINTQPLSGIYDLTASTLKTISLYF